MLRGGRAHAWPGVRDGVLSVKALVRGGVLVKTGGVLVMLAALVVALGVPAVLTWLGQRRRGSGRGLASLAALFFPVAWTVWYVADEHPYRTR